jgi:hypothetical protein
MSHFVGIVLLDGVSSDPSAVEVEVLSIAEPYCEERKVSAYDRPCGCVDTARSNAATRWELTWIASNNSSLLLV